MDFILNILVFALVLGIIVLIHELGHLLAAKAFGVYCHEFSIGMGPAIASFKKDHWETTYSIRALPLGGYVAMAGEDVPPEMMGGVEVPKDRTLDGIKAWKRLIVMLAGIFMNLVLAFVLFWGLISSQGIVQSPEPIIQEVSLASPAEEAGLQAGDRIVKMTFYDGKTLKPETFDDVLMGLSTYEHRSLELDIDRDGEALTIEITPEYSEEHERYLIGIVAPMGQVEKVSFFAAAPYAIGQIGMIIQQFFFIITRLFRGIGLNNVGGPIGIYEVTSQVRVHGFIFFINLVALLSVNLAVVNLLPIPVMDGGRALLTLIEMIRGRPLDKKVENFIMNIGLILILALFIFIMYNDIRKAF